MVNEPLIRPFFWGGTLGGGRLISHETTFCAIFGLLWHQERLRQILPSHAELQLGLTPQEHWKKPGTRSPVQWDFQGPYYKGTSLW